METKGCSFTLFQDQKQKIFMVLFTPWNTHNVDFSPL